MFGESSYRAEQSTRSQAPSVAQARTLAAAAEVTGFLELGQTELAQDRLCLDCPMKALCGAAVYGLAARYKRTGQVPAEVGRTVRQYGIDIDPEGIEICPSRMVQLAGRAVVQGEFQLDEADPLRDANPRWQAAQTTMLATQDVLARINSGQRL